MTISGKKAREVDECCPHADDGTEYLMSRKELAKYSPCPAVSYQVIAQMELT